MALERWRPRFGALTRWDPFAELRDLQREMDRLFDSFFGRARTEIAETGWSPLVDLYETKDNLVVKAELPGVKPEEVEVSIVGDTLTLKGERKEEKEAREEGYYHRELTYGAFHRSLTLPQTVDPGKVKATFKNGILEIVLPKKEEAKPKAIKVEVA